MDCSRPLQRTLRSSRTRPSRWTGCGFSIAKPVREARQQEIQLDLFYDYRTNVVAYPEWQAYLRQQRPRTLVVWGKYDPSFTVAGALAYGRDVPNAEIHLLDAGHFALDEATPVIAATIREFLGRIDAAG